MMHIYDDVKEELRPNYAKTQFNRKIGTNKHQWHY